MDKELNPVRKFLWWVACTDEAAILLCSPVTQSLQSLSGLAIVITTALAFLSGGYAMFEVFRSVATSILLSSIYAAAIFNIDRFIVSARMTRLAWIRLPLSLVVACVIAVPVELRLVEERIDQQLARQDRADNHDAEGRRLKQRDEIDAKIGRLEQQADQYRAHINEWGERIEAEVVGRVRSGTTGMKGEGPAYRAAVEEKQLSQNLLNQVTAELEKLRQQRASMLSEVDKEYQHEHVNQAGDLVARYEALGVIETEHPDVAKMTWGIRIVLMLIEAFPAFAKLMLPYTGYLALVEAREREDIQRVHSMANHNIRQMTTDPQDPDLFVMKQTFTIKQKAGYGKADRYGHSEKEKHQTNKAI